MSTPITRARRSAVLERAMQALRDLAARPGGATLSEIQASSGCSRDVAHTAVRKLVQSHAVIRSQTGNTVRWFAAAADAVRHAEQATPIAYLQPIKRRLDNPQEQGVVQHQNGMRITVAPGWTHDPRFQLPPGVKADGAGFAAAGIGRYLDDTA